MPEIIQGTSLAPGLPPVDLPTLGDEQQQRRLRIEINRAAPAAQQEPTVGQVAKPWSAPSAPSGLGASEPTVADLAKVWTPREPKTPEREVGSGEATLRGLAGGASFEFEPSIVGGYQAAKTALGYGQPGQSASDAYEQARQSELEENQRALEQHPYLFRAGELGGAAGTMLVPGLGAARAATTLGRIATASRAGAIGGALTGAGQEVSRGAGAGDVATSAALGGVVGGVLGGGASGVLEGAGQLGGKIVSAIRGARDVDAEASRRIVRTLRSDFANEGPQFTPGQVRMARQAGTPMAVVDVGGERTLAMARSAANTSPEARRALQGLADRRFEQQSDRISNFVGNLTGGQRLNTEALQAAARRANAPAYKRAYAVADRRFPGGVWSEKAATVLSPRASRASIPRSRLRTACFTSTAPEVRPPIPTYSSGTTRSGRCATWLRKPSAPAGATKQGRCSRSITSSSKSWTNGPLSLG
jgi:hypothetical protein